MAGGLPEPSRDTALEGGLAGRTIHEVRDLSAAEQLYLYERTRRFKARKRDANPEAEGPALCEIPDDAVEERVDNPDCTVYLIFMEGSTRTRESLRNAAVYHGVKVNEFQAETSSFQKNETITDTMKMLSVYSTQRSVFVIRSVLEGVCSWLRTAMGNHAASMGVPLPSFLNAGDGLFTHPIGEFVDMYSLLEQNRWNRETVHLALVGDLAHGRTAHSKVEGLKLFQKVTVDLVAPEIFSYPVEYRNRMREEGFEVREFASVEEYLEKAAGSIADVWYFYKPQFSKCGDLSAMRLSELRTQVSFREEFLPKLLG
ncbi:pyrBI [Symbiodinium natans]|uniref:PyrBI protein n=1 Tax=Symbiodinium natans TaxID=878477 RepID=A0A812NZA1_9DINO|nr:pyrBI [Symbiodinium natans]